MGAGGGFFTVRLSCAVGPSGRVYAVDVGAQIIEKLKHRVSEAGLLNVELVQGAVDDPRLLPGSLDAALIVNSYHEMTEHQAMLQKIQRALKPGGRLVIVEPISARRREQARASQIDSHEIAAGFVLDEARAAGFRVVRLEDPFATQPESNDEEWLMVLAPAVVETAGRADPPKTPFEQTKDADWKAPELRISVEEFKKLYADDAVLVLDVRDPESYRQGHLPGALLLTPDTIEARAADLRKVTKPIVTYCS